MSSSGNTLHGVAVNIEQEYKRYEKLAPAVREFLRNSFFDWKVPTLGQVGNPDDYVDMMVRHDVVNSKNQARDWGDAQGWVDAQGSRKRREWKDRAPIRATKGKRA